MIALSLGVHLLLFLWFTYQGQVAVGTRRGVVSVSFIESVVHQPEPEQHVRRAKTDTVSAKPQSQAQSKTESTQPPQSEVQTQAAEAEVVNETGIFIGTVSKLVAQHRIYPQEAINREQEGKVIVGLTLDREGILTAANVEEASPFQLLNDAALKTVHAVGHYPHVPDIVPAPIHLHIPLVYRIERN